VTVMSHESRSDLDPASIAVLARAGLWALPAVVG
jgi:hypothetical protein